MTPLTDRERLALRRVALPTLLAALTMQEAARIAAVRSIDTLTALAEAQAWAAERRGRRGEPRARRVLRARAGRAIEAADVLERAVYAAAEWAARLGREMTAVRDAERDYLRARDSATVPGW